MQLLLGLHALLRTLSDAATHAVVPRQISRHPGAAGREYRLRQLLEGQKRHQRMLKVLRKEDPQTPQAQKLGEVRRLCLG